MVVLPALNSIVILVTAVGEPTVVAPGATEGTVVGWAIVGAVVGGVVAVDAGTLVLLGAALTVLVDVALDVTDGAAVFVLLAARAVVAADVAAWLAAGVVPLETEVGEAITVPGPGVAVASRPRKPQAMAERANGKMNKANRCFEPGNVTP